MSGTSRWNFRWTRTLSARSNPKFRWRGCQKSLREKQLNRIARILEGYRLDKEIGAELDGETKYYFDLADVEYCVDVTITEILNEKIVTGYGAPRKPPTLSEIFQKLFGEDDPLTRQVEDFEDLISGYDDHVHIDDLQQAYNVISEIVKELEGRSRD